MIPLMLAQVTTTPEAVINAAIAATAAQQAASQAFGVSMVVLGLMILVFVGMLAIAYNFHALERNTNSMKDALVEATRKLALFEGKVIGKEEEEKRAHSVATAAAAAAAAAAEKKGA